MTNPTPTSQDTASEGQRSRRPLIWGGAAVVALLGIGGLWYFQPQKLLIDERVDERITGLSVPSTAAASATSPADNAAAPTTTAAPAGTAAPAAPSTTAAAPTTTAAPSGPRVTASGSFLTMEHTTRGNALLVVRPDGTSAIQFTEFRTDNGPDVRIYLSPEPSPTSARAKIDPTKGGLYLGKMKGNVGDQFYEIPAGTDTGRFQSVVIWCERFSVPFAAAPLDAV